MEELLGLRLEDALAALRAKGVEPTVLRTAAPRGERPGGTLRVVRVQGDTLTVASFQDATPSDE